MRPRPTLLAAMLLLGATTARAHPLSPPLLSLEAREGGEVSMLWRTPRDGTAATQIRPRLPEACAVEGAPERTVDDAWRDERQRLRCPPRGLVGARVGVAGLEATGGNALVLVRLPDGRTIRALLSPASPSLVIPDRESHAGVAAAFFGLGLEHLATGVDHLLFVGGLVVLLRRGRRLAAAVTAFTAGHSVTLALATLGTVRAPQALVEIGIAASLVALAAAIVGAGVGARPGILSRRPFAAPFAFGLLHGLGFAGALGEAGLPAGEVPLALAGFNFGIEAAQLACVGLLLGLAQALRALPEPWRRATPRIAADLIGAVGVFLVLDRLTGFLRP